MDANGNIIPIVENDQGEGFKDPYEGKDDPFFSKELEKHDILREEFFLSQRKEEKGKDSYQDQVEKNLADAEVKALAKQPPPPQRMRIKKGMVIHFYGFAYKCTAARPNGKVTLKLKGLWKGDQK